jgi:Fe-S-cluster containining protein
VDLPLYFAFPDGAFHYVCAECTALCCRAGGGFGGSLHREMNTLLTVYPELQSMVVARRADYISIATPIDHCHFLRDDNRCRVEVQHGKTLKPGVCLLFPFNVFTRIGNTVAISPHFVMCPLRLQAPPRPGEVEGTHAALETAVRETALLPSDPVVFDATMRPAALHPSETEQSVLVRERSFRDTCGQALARKSFRDVVRGASTDPAHLEARVAQATRVLGIPELCETPGRDDVDDLLLALAPSLRLDYLRLPSDGILLALLLAEQILRRVLSLSSKPPTPQGTYKIVSSVHVALCLLGCADTPLVIPRKASKRLPFFGDPDMTFAAYRVLSANSPVIDILDLLETAMGRLSTASDRSAFLLEMGARIRPQSRRQRSQMLKAQL